MDQSGIELHRRSDGFVETPNGEIAVVMTSMTVQYHDGKRRLSFKTSHQSNEISLNWHKDEILQIFPGEASKAALTRGFARHPTDEEVELFFDDLAVSSAKTTPVNDSDTVNSPSQEKKDDRKKTEAKKNVAPGSYIPDDENDEAGSGAETGSTKPEQKG